MNILSPNVIATLHRCLQACVAAEKGYAKAAEASRDPVLRAVFHVYERQRADFAEALQSILDRLGIVGLDDRTESSAPHRKIQGTRPAREDRDEAIVLEDALRGDATAARVYATAVQCSRCVPAEVRSLLTGQEDAIKDALEDVRSRAHAPVRRLG